MYNSTKIKVIKLLFDMTRFAFLVTIVSMTLTGVLLGADVKSQSLNEAKITLSTTKTTLAVILNKIEQQSEFTFSFGKRIGEMEMGSFQAYNKSLDIVLKELATGRHLKFTQLGDLIAINELPAPPKPGRIYGKITDDKGEPLPGASIKVMELGKSIQSSVDGSYQFSVPPGTYTLESSYIAYQTKRIADVTVNEGGLNKLDLVLNPAKNALSEVVVRSSFRREAVAGLYAQQKNAASVTDGISAEQIARTPDNNMGQVLKRVSGVTTVDNRFVVVRGLTERYNQAMIDGVVLPSTDMNRRNFSFDVIPVEMVSNVVVNKSATPDISSEFAGGQVSVNTADIPLQNFTILGVGTGFNSNTLGKDFIQAGKTGKYDFLGFDDGHRKLPGGIQNWTGNNNEAPPDFAGTQSGLFSSDVFRKYRSTGSSNQNYRLSLGRVYDLKKDKKWGFVGGLSLRDNQETNVYQSVRSMNLTSMEYPIALIDTAFGRRNGHIYTTNSTLGAQFNVGIQGERYKIGLKNIYSQIFSNSFNTSEGSRQIVQEINQQRDQSNRQDPRVNQILQHKLEGENSLTSSGLKLTWFGARTTVRQETKDHTKFIYRLSGRQDSVEYFQTPNIITPGSNENDFDYRLFTDTKETDYNWALNLSQPFNFLNDKSIVKAGYQGSHKQRTLDATILDIFSQDATPDIFFSQAYEDIMAPDNVGTGKQKAYYIPQRTNGRQFDGSADFSAGYLMLDQHFLNKVRLVYGMRIENYKLENKQSEAYREAYESGVLKEVTGEKNTNFLPSANLTYNITPKVNLRASFAKTIIRPDFRETSYFGFYDVDLNANIIGADLISTRIENTDLRLEWYPSAGEIISISGFYKRFDRPIELVAHLDPTGGNKPTEYRLQNQRNAENYGAEMEIRKSLGFIADKQWLRNFTLFGNGTVIRSRINTLSQQGDGTFIEDKTSRSLYGQSPYVLNYGASYASSVYGLTVNYNRSGRRTYTISTNPGLTEYENGRDQVDLQLFTRWMKGKMELKLNVGNILNTTSFFYMNVNGYRIPENSGTGFEATGNGTDSYEKEFDDVRYRVKTGVTSSLLVSYKF